MNKHQALAEGQSTPSIMRTASVECAAPDAISNLAVALSPDDLDLVVLFLSAQTDLGTVLPQIRAAFDGTQVIGCTTAGEVSKRGYEDGTIVAVGFPSSHFRSTVTVIEGLGTLNPQPIIDGMIRNRNQLRTECPNWPAEFAFLMVDGLSMREDALASQLAHGLGSVPLFGGSAGDGNAFEQSFLLTKDGILTDAAILAQVRSRCPVKVFKSDHFRPTEQRMVVTSADPAQRIVHEINAEPAGREYARILGKDPEQLNPFTFAAHPVVVRIGDQHHVRSIQTVNPNGDLVFFSAIDEGIVLTLAEPDDMVEHLERELAALSVGSAPDMILGCDCMLRKVEAEQKQLTGALSRIMAAHRMIGFSTYGEQVNSMHVNQTLTGVAIYPPKDG